MKDILVRKLGGDEFVNCREPLNLEKKSSYVANFEPQKGYIQ